MRIMIVDDEEKIRLGLSKLIEKASRHYEIIGIYANAADCLEALGSQKPDVVITDIKMPGMTGLELAKVIKQRYEDIKCVILSGFGEFEYARAAIASGVAAYLLKPVDKQELYTLLEELQASLPSEKATSGPITRDPVAIKNLLMGKVDKQAGAAAVCEQHPDFAYAAAYAVIVLVTDTGMPRTAFRNWLKGSGVQQLEMIELDARSTALIAAFDEREESSVHVLEGQLIHILALERTFHASVGISRLLSQVQDWTDGYREAQEAIEYNFYSLERSPLSLAEHVQFGTLHKVESYRKRVLESMEIFDVPGVERHLREMFREIALIKIRIHHLVELVETLFYALNKEAGKRQENVSQNVFSIDWGAELKKCFTFTEAKALIELRLIEGLVLLMTGRSNQGNTMIYQIKKIIEQEYAESLDLNSLAKRVFLTPSYLSKLFKQETDTTVIEYIISVRMNKAKELLKDHLHLKTYQVGELVGYKDPAYFNKQFKKVVGLTPKEYRDIVS
ncbi:response regulator [Paenibacillus sp. SI8]|uniref:response regulator n=1 Tax=unclassified Paenibacillus TaxID=185978 RepID=UPI00346686CE